MSAQFNDITAYKGLVQLFERECGFQRGDVSGDTSRLKEFTVDANMAFDEFLTLAFRSEGTWQFDDSNQTDYPIITTNLISGQRDYSFVSDQDGNLLLEVYKVFIANSSGVYAEIFPVDVSTGEVGRANTQATASGQIWNRSLSSFTDGQNASGIPTRYDKLANSVFLDPIPNYNYTNGLKVYINREPSYFVYTDTTKKPGVPGIFHSWFYVRPAEDYARRNSLSTYQSIQSKRIQLERDIQEYFSSRDKDVRKAMIPGYQDNK